MENSNIESIGLVPRHQNNFTALRWLAAGLVLFGHSFIFLGLPAPSFLNGVPLGTLGVYIFFAISGYLVAQSWESDPHPVRFLQRRALRIFPGLSLCIVLSIFLLGPFLTNLNLTEYFFHAQTRNYFSNIALYMSYNLPGLFSTNQYPYAVNGSLWSLPAEFSMYLILALLGAARIPRMGWLVATIGFIVLAKCWAMQAPDMLVVYRTDVRQVVICGTYFWVGATLLKYKVHRLFCVSNVLIATIILFMLTHWPQMFVVASGVILPFLAIAFGLAQSPLLVRFTKYDYSYGIYIYAFPVQQTIAHFWPRMSLYYYLILTSLITVVLAGLSWHWVERPALKLKPTRPQ